MIFESWSALRWEGEEEEGGGTEIKIQRVSQLPTWADMLPCADKLHLSVITYPAVLYMCTSTYRCRHDAYTHIYTHIYRVYTKFC